MLEADRLGKYVQSVGFFCCYENPRTEEVEGAHQSKKKKIAVVLCHRGHVMKKV